MSDLSGGARTGRHRVSGPTRGVRINHQVYWLTSGRIVGALLQAVTLGVLSRGLGPAGFGLVAGTVGAVQASIAIGDLGVTPTILRTRARSRTDPLTGALLTLNTRVSLLLGLLWTVVLVSAWASSGEIAYLFLLPLAVWVVTEKNTETSLMIPLADGRALELVFSLVLRRSTALALLLAALHFGAEPLLAYSGALAAAGLTGVVWIRRRLPGTLPKRCRPAYVPLLRAAFPFWLATLAVQGRAFDVSIVRVAAGDYVSGVYAAPSRITGALSLLPNSIAQVALPVAARGDRAGLRVLARALVGAMLMMTAVFAVIAVCAEPALRLALGPEFGQSARPLRVILVGLVFLGFSSSFISLLQASGDEWFVALACLFSTAVCFAGVFVGAGTAGATGAATALTASYMTQTVLLGGRMWRLRSRLFPAADRSEGRIGRAELTEHA